MCHYIKTNIRKLFDKTFIRFIIVGVINTLFGTTVMFSLYNLVGCNYWVSSIANYFFGSILSYFLNKYFTFQNREKSFKIVVKFIINISVCYVLAYGLAKPLVRIALQNMKQKVQENVAMLVGMTLFVVLNYMGQKFVCFRTMDCKQD